MSYPEWDEIRDSLLRGRNVPMIEADMPTFMGLPHATSPEDLEGADVVIIGAPYVVVHTRTKAREYGGVSIMEWVAAPKRVRQQSVKYGSGYIQDFDIDLFEHLRVVDYGDAEIPPEVFDRLNVADVLKSQRAVETKVNHVLDAGAIPIVIGQNSPCGSYAIAKPIAERTKGNIGVISTDTHWDIQPLDHVTMDPRVAGSGSWKAKMYEFHENMLQKNLIEIGERGPSGGKKEEIREFLAKGTHFYPMWEVRAKGVEWLCNELNHAYDETEAIYVHLDMDVLGGAGSAPGDILGTLAEPMGMNDYEILRLSYEIGKRGFDAMSFICIPPGSALGYRTIVYVILYMLSGMVVANKEKIS
ncbi:arginase family protein [Thermoproteota archaeon]